MTTTARRWRFGGGGGRGRGAATEGRRGGEAAAKTARARLARRASVALPPRAASSGSCRETGGRQATPGGRRRQRGQRGAGGGRRGNGGNGGGHQHQHDHRRENRPRATPPEGLPYGALRGGLSGRLGQVKAAALHLSTAEALAASALLLLAGLVAVCGLRACARCAPILCCLSSAASPLLPRRGFSPLPTAASPLSSAASRCPSSGSAGGERRTPLLTPCLGCILAPLACMYTGAAALVMATRKSTARRAVPRVPERGEPESASSRSCTCDRARQDALHPCPATSPLAADAVSCWRPPPAACRKPLSPGSARRVLRCERGEAVLNRSRRCLRLQTASRRASIGGACGRRGRASPQA